MNFKPTRQEADMICFMLKKHIKTHSGLMFCKPSKTILHIWPTDIFLQIVNILQVQELCK